MGVKGLWRLLLPIGRRISLETLEGKILAIDASIWLTQFLKALRDPQTGQSQPAAHLIGFIRRLCRLYFHGIRPVLVFDGATPEIKQREILDRRKRREQFAHAASDAGVQRLARRLLAQNLQNMKKSPAKKLKAATSNRAGFAPGFNPGSQSTSSNNSNNAQSGKPKDAPPSKPSGDGNSKDPPKVSMEDEAAILASIRQDLEAEEEEAIRASSANDWDDVIVIDETDAKEDEEKEAEVEYDDYELRQVKLRFKQQIDMDYIASLPMNKRKDAIEEAKRRQRLQSRKEFMPAAGNMDEFSSVQIQNFLKSSRLNLDIQKMAKEEVKRNNEHGGDLMASDRTTRISLIREDENKTDKEIPIEDDPLFRKRPTKRQRRLIARKDSSDEDDDIDWQDGFKEQSATSGTARARRRVLMDDDSDDETPAPNHKKSKVNGQHKPSSTPTHHPSVSSSKTALQADFEGGGFLPNDFEGEGGFLTSATPATQVNPRSDVLDAEPEKKSTSKMGHMLVLECDDSSDDGSADGGGGFLTGRDNAAMNKDIIEVEDGGSSARATDRIGDSEEEPEIIEIEESGSVSHAAGPDTSKDAAIAQEMADATLAEALQKESYSGIREGRPTTVATGAVQRFENASDDSSNDDIEWEDGDEAPEQTVNDFPKESTGATLSSQQMGQEKQNTDDDDDDDDDDNIEWVDGEENVDDDKKHEAKRASLEHAESDDDEIQWMDGEDDVAASKQDDKGSRAEKTQGRGLYSSTRGVDDEVEEIELPKQPQPGKSSIDREMKLLSNVTTSEAHQEEQDGRNERPDIPDDAVDEDDRHQQNSQWEVEAANDWGTFDDVTSQNQPTRHRPENENAGDNNAAIARAEETAANLAGWAGRAFRRAMRESGNLPEEEEDEPPERIENTGICDNHGEMPREMGTAQIGNHDDRQSPAKRPPPAPSARKSLLPQLTENDEARASTTALLQEYEAKWASERNQRERDVDTVTDEMKEEAMVLLRLFGVPFVESPAEAEAQCAALEQLGLVDGIVTEDSDVFVFGGKKVYKNIFDERLYAEAYMAEDAEREMSIGKNAMVALAMLLGSDYTQGVKGVGIVNAMEVLKAFDVSEDLREGLKSFRVWLDGFDPSDAGLEITDEDVVTPRKSFHAKHRSARSRWVAPEHFPADNIINAYVNPVVDKSPEKFSWGVPDVEGLVAFCSRHMGWPEEQTRKTLEPVVLRAESGERYRQTRLDSFMRYEDSIKFADVKSKRLREVLGLKEDPAKPAAKRNKS